MQDGDRRGLPAHRDVALVGRHHRAAFPGPVHHLAQVPGRQDPAGGVGRRVHPHQPDPGRAGPEQAVRGQRRGPGDPGADVVRRVRQLGLEHHVTGTEPEHDRKPGDEFLGADDGQHVLRRHGNAVVAGQPAGRRGPQPGRSPGRGVTGGVGGGRQGVADKAGHRIDRRPHGKIHGAVRMVPGFLAQRRDPVPRESGKPAREGHSSALMPAGSAATTGWSLPVLPALEAPPGEPRSSKKSTLTL
jgi:hypothetical protein